MAQVRTPYLIEEVAAELDWPKREVKECIDTFFQIVMDELAEGNEVMISTLVKFKFRVTPAIKKGTLVWNPLTQERKPSPGRPATLSVKALALAKIKKSAPPTSTKLGKAMLSEFNTRAAAKKAA